MTDEPKKPRGFACLSPEERKAMASRAGRATKPHNRHFARNPDAAVDAGRKGGAALWDKRKGPRLPI
jgi:general stress protein YciG